MFGDKDEEYSLRALINMGVTPPVGFDNIVVSKDYCDSYFIRVPNGFYFWDALKKKAEWLTTDEFETKYYTTHAVALKFPDLEDKVVLFDYVLNGDIYHLNTNVNCEKAYTCVIDDEKYLNIPRNRKFTEVKLFKDFPRYIKKKVIVFLIYLYKNISKCRRSKFKLIHDIFMHIITSRKMKNIGLHLHSNDQIILLFDFLIEHVIGKDNAFVLNNLAVNHASLIGKSIAVLNNKKRYNPVKVMTVRNQIGNLISVDVDDEKNDANLVIITKQNLLNKKLNDDNFLTINLSSYVMDEELKKCLNDGEFGEALYWYAEEYMINYDKNSKDKNIIIEYDDDIDIDEIYGEFIRYLINQQIFKKKILSITDFTMEYYDFCKKKYSSTEIFDPDKFMILYDDFSITNNNKKRKSMKAMENKMQIDTLMVIKSILNVNNALINEYVKDMIILPKKNVNKYFSTVYDKFELYCLLVYNETSIMKKSKARIEINENFGKKIITESYDGGKRNIMKLSSSKISMDSDIFNNLDIVHNKSSSKTKTRSNRGRGKKDTED